MFSLSSLTATDRIIQKISVPHEIITLELLIRDGDHCIGRLDHVLLFVDISGSVNIENFILGRKIVCMNDTQYWRCTAQRHVKYSSTPYSTRLTYLYRSKLDNIIIKYAN